MQPNKKDQRKIWYISIVMLLLIVLTACANDGNAGADDNDGGSTDRKTSGDSQKVVAVYEGGEVQEEEFNSYFYVDKFFYETIHAYYEQGDPTGFKEQMLQSYISFKILGDRADEETIASTEEEVEQRMTLFDESLETNEDEKTLWETKSAEWGITKDDVKRYVSVQATALNYVRSQATEDKLQELYDDTLAGDPEAYTAATVRHVLIAFEPESGDARSKEDALALAQEIQGKLNAGEDFAEVAKEYSDDPGSKASGGKYVSVLVNDWVEPFKEAVLSLPIGDISAPVETEYGYHIITVEERQKQSLEDVKELLEGQVVDQIYTDFIANELPALIEKIDLRA